MGLCKNLIQNETRGKNGHMSDSRIRGTCCPIGKKEEKEKKMIAHGPSNKQYASKR